MTKEAVRGLYGIADTGLCAPGEIASRVERALRGGAALIQYRHKGSIDGAHLAGLRRLRELCRMFRVPLLINDDIALALALDADGVHLGREDTPIPEARAALGPARLIGASCYNDLQLARDARDQGADYLAFGSFFASPTKPGAVRAAPGLLAEARGLTGLPLVAIGGITPGNGAALIAAGAHALAVISGVFAQRDPEKAARRYARLFDTAPATIHDPDSREAHS